MSTNKSNKTLEKSLSSMREQDKKKFLKTIASVFCSVLFLCFGAIMLFSCNMNSIPTVSTTETNWREFLIDNEFIPVEEVTWNDVPTYLKSISKLVFLEGGSNLVARVYSNVGIEEGSFTFTGKAKGSLSLYQATLTVSITENSLRLVTANNEILDFAVTKTN